MLEEIRKAVRKVPFQPFGIELSSGEMEDDKGVIDVLSSLQTARIRYQELKKKA